MTDPRSPQAPDGSRGVIAYLCPLAAGGPPLDLAIQRRAAAACAGGEGLGEPEWFEDGDPAVRTAFAGAVDRLDATGDGVAIVPTLAVLGATSVQQAWRLLALMYLGDRVVFADGRLPEDALRAARSDRPDEERRRERAREGMRRRALRAEVLGRPPFGYAVEGRTLVPHPKEAPVVERIFALYLDEDEGIRRIAGQLNRDGIKTRRGGPWSAGSVRTVLRNPAYIGLYRRLGVAVPKAHPALVPAQRFHEVQRRLDDRRTSAKVQQRHRYLLAGLVRCGYCGNRIIGARRAAPGGVTVLYRCESATNLGRCRYGSRHADELEALVRGELVRPAEPLPVAVHADATDEDTDGRRERAERQIARMLERWESGEWGWADLVRRAGPVAETLVEAERPVPAGAEIDAAGARERLVQEWDALPFAERRRLLQAAVAEVVVTDDAVRVTRRR